MHVVHGSHDGLVMQSWDTSLVLQEQISFSERSLPKVFIFFFVNHGTGSCPPNPVRNVASEPAKTGEECNAVPPAEKL